MANVTLLSLLTKREIDVIYAYCEYETIKETAVFLHLSNQTVKNHLSNIYHKLGVMKGHAAVYRLGLHEWLDVPDIKIDPEMLEAFVTASTNPDTVTDAYGFGQPKPDFTVTTGEGSNGQDIQP